MIQSGWQNIFSVYWLCWSIMLLASLFTLFLTIYKIIAEQNVYTYYLIFTYQITSILQGGFSFYLAYSGFINNKFSPDAVTANIFMLIEFEIFSLLFYKVLKSRLIKSIISSAMIIFPLICILYWLKFKTITINPYNLSVVEILYLISICLVYFFELFKSPPTKKLTNEPEFWYFTGILLYLVCLLPNCLMLQFVSLKDLIHYNILVMAVFVACILLNVFFIKALLCKTSQPTLSSL